MKKSEVKRIKGVLFRRSFKVAIFGSARIKKGHHSYEQVFNLARMIGLRDIDLLTGGGPGLMAAANKGHSEGAKMNDSKSIGLLINIPHEKVKSHSDIEEKFSKFSDRLDNFIVMSNAVVVAPGGIGTMLELFYTWQLLQTHKIKHIPVILLGDMWADFIKWIKAHPVRHKFIDNKDLELVHVAKNAHEAIEIIDKEYKKYKIEN